MAEVTRMMGVTDNNLQEAGQKEKEKKERKIDDKKQIRNNKKRQ